MAEKESGRFFTYKGLPLARKGDEIYFGNMYDKYVVMIKILSEEEKGGIKVANKVKVLKLATEPSPPVKTAERKNLYEALDVACAWLKI